MGWLEIFCSPLLKMGVEEVLLTSLFPGDSSGSTELPSVHF